MFNLMSEKIISILQEKQIPVSFDDLKFLLNINNDADSYLLMQSLNELKANNIIEVDKNQKYFLIIKKTLLSGILSLNLKGFGFIKIQDGIEYFVKSENIKNALDGDEVLFFVLDNQIKEKNNHNNEVKIIKVLKRKLDFVVGTIVFNEVQQQIGLKVNNIKLQNYQVKLVNPEKAIIGSIVIAKICDVSLEKHLVLLIDKVIGDINHPGDDILAIVYEYNIKTTFNEETLNEANKIGLSVKESDLVNRRDLTNELFITIDGKDAKDLDDAISVKKLDNDNYKLLVAIADVSYYVKENSFLDKEALLRGTSIYLTDRVIPMLPSILSNGICSLNANILRLVIVCEMEINKKGQNISYNIYPAIIKIKRRMNYDEVNDAFNNKKPSFINSNPEIYSMLLNALKLHNILKKYKYEAGVVDFDLNESKIIINKSGKIENILIKFRDKAEMLIESFMVRANETVADAIYWMNLPFIYRVHHQPKLKKIQEVYTILKMMGFNFKRKVTSVYSKDLQQTLEMIKNQPWFQVISTLFLRSMEKASYDVNNTGHFGLASSCYTHFTSPIRRYPDLVVHRMLRKYLFEKEINSKTIDVYMPILNFQAQQSSKCEIKALECERAVEQMKKAEYMEKQVGKTFIGVISSVTSFGIFVILENTIEGLVHISDMKDDYYHYNEKSLRLIGERTRKEYYLGQKVSIKVKRSSKSERKIDFLLINKKNYNHRGKYENNRNKS